MGRDNCGWDTGSYREQKRGRGQEVNQDARDRINKRATERAVHENLRRIGYDAAHGPPGIRQFSSHLGQVIWPRNFKLEKLKNTTARKTLKTGSLSTRLQFDQQQETSTSWQITCQSSLTRLAISGSSACPRTPLTLGKICARHL